MSAMQSGTQMVKLKAGSKGLVRLFYLDEHRSCIRWRPSRKSEKAKITIDSLYKVTEGRQSDIFHRHAENSFDPACCFTVYHGNHMESLDLVTSNPEEARTWVTGLRYLMAGISDEDSLAKRQRTHDQYPFKTNTWMKQTFEEADKNGDGLLNMEEIYQLLHKMNVNLPRRKVKHMFQEADSDDQQGTLTFEEFSVFYKMMSLRRDLYLLLMGYSDRKDHLTADELANFLLNEQKMVNVTTEYCLDVIEKFELSEENKQKGILGIEGKTAKCRTAKCRTAKCRTAKCRTAKCRTAKCRTAKCRTAKCRTAKCRTAKCRTAKCRTAKCRTAKCRTAKCRTAKCRTMTATCMGMSNANWNYLCVCVCSPPPPPLQRHSKSRLKSQSTDGEEDGQETSGREAGGQITRGGRKRKTMKLSRDLSDLVVFTNSVASQEGLDDSTPGNVLSFSETRAQQLVNHRAERFLCFNQRQLSRIYPSAYRIDSSNFNPQLYWNVGCQLVALNYQTEGRMMQLNRAKFMVNGGCGYVLKPPPMCKGSFNPFSDDPLPAYPKKQLVLKIISGQQLPKPPDSMLGDRGEVHTHTDTFSVEIIGLPVDCCKEQTRVVDDNGFNPVWEENLSFTIHMAEVALVRFLVWDHDPIGRDFVGQRTVAFSSLMPGYRHVYLEGLTEASIFIHVSVHDIYGKGRQLRGIRGLFNRPSKSSVDTSCGSALRKRSISDHLLRRTASAPANRRKKTKMKLAESSTSISDRKASISDGKDRVDMEGVMVERRPTPLTHRPISMPLERLLQGQLSLCSPNEEQTDLGADTLIGMSPFNQPRSHSVELIDRVNPPSKAEDVSSRQRTLCHLSSSTETESNCLHVPTESRPETTLLSTTNTPATSSSPSSSSSEPSISLLNVDRSDLQSPVPLQDSIISQLIDAVSLGNDTTYGSISALIGQFDLTGDQNDFIMNSDPHALSVMSCLSHPAVWDSSTPCKVTIDYTTQYKDPQTTTYPRKAMNGPITPRKASQTANHTNQNLLPPHPKTSHSDPPPPLLFSNTQLQRLTQTQPQSDTQPKPQTQLQPQSGHPSLPLLGSTLTPPLPILRPSTVPSPCKSKSLSDLTSEDISCNFHSKYNVISRSFITPCMKERRRMRGLGGLSQRLQSADPLTKQLRKLEDSPPLLSRRLSSRSQSRVRHINNRARERQREALKPQDMTAPSSVGGVVLRAKVAAGQNPPANRHSTGSYIAGYLEQLEDRGLPEGGCTTLGYGFGDHYGDPYHDDSLLPTDSCIQSEPEVYFLLRL
uniref:Phosphoinositide phospholipase C n=1 Tax=Salmo trutta TaxID=8032 RepID=A0A673WGW7_SALTR